MPHFGGPCVVVVERGHAAHSVEVEAVAAVRAVDVRAHIAHGQQVHLLARWAVAHLVADGGEQAEPRKALQLLVRQ